jgi:hypothetical protein
MALKKLRVLPNPSHALDHEGRPQCAVQFENARGDYWVGASVDQERTLAARKTFFVFDEETPVEVPPTGYYVRKLLDGELLPADAETAKLAGVPFPVKSVDQPRAPAPEQPSRSRRSPTE